MYRMCMEDKIKQLIEHHKLAKAECYSSLNSFERTLTPHNDEVFYGLEKEYEMRSIFINELEDLI